MYVCICVLGGGKGRLGRGESWSEEVRGRRYTKKGDESKEWEEVRGGSYREEMGEEVIGNEEEIGEGK